MDASLYDRALRVLRTALHLSRARTTIPCDELYYELILNYHRRVRQAPQEGRPIVAFGLMLPNEVLYALNLVPFHLEVASAMLVPILRKYEEAFALAKEYGLPGEMCSAHRLMAAVHLQHWIPRPQAVVWGSTICASAGKSGELIRRAWDIPGFFLDRPYCFQEKTIHHFALELEDMVGFLEETTGCRLDQERLREAMGFSQRTIEVQRQINALRRTIPFPGINRWVNQFIVINWLYLGYPEALAFSRKVLAQMEEWKELKSAPYPERFRLLSLFPPPLYHWKLLDWLQEKGACLVADPMSSYWQEWEADPAQPFLSLARRAYLEPHCYTMHGPGELAVEAAVRQAEETRAEGAIYWASAGCRQGCGLIRCVKDALLELGLPTQVVDMEVVDPGFAPEEELKDRLEGFLEVLEARR